MSADRLWLGKSGARYPFSLPGEFRSASIVGVGGVYMFVKPVPVGAWLPIYIGSADDLSVRLSDHERQAEAIEMGATGVMIHVVSEKTARESEEWDLIRLWCPALNPHPIPADGIAALIRARRRVPFRSRT